MNAEEIVARALGSEQDDRGRAAPVFAGTALHPRQAVAIAQAVVAVLTEAGFNLTDEWEYGRDRGSHMETHISNWRSTRPKENPHDHR